MDRFLNSQLREVSTSLKKFDIKLKDDTLLESFLIILVRFRHLRDLADNFDFHASLKELYRGQNCLKPVVALFNLIYSIYTVDKEASSAEIAQVLKEIRKNYQNHPLVKKMNDIELFLLAISSSFRVFHYMTEQRKIKSEVGFEKVLADLFSYHPADILKYQTIRNIVDKAFQDLRARKSNIMEVESTEARHKILLENIEEVHKMCKKTTTMPNLAEELNFCSVLFHYDDEESALFNRLLDGFNQKLLQEFGDNYINPDVIKPIRLDFMRDECSLHRFDMRNQVNFGYLNIYFKYLSTTKSCNCDITCVMEKTSASSEDGEVFGHNVRITYTGKVSLDMPGIKQQHDILRVPKIRNFLTKINEQNQDLDIINDYDCVAFYQVLHPVLKIHYYRFLSIERRLKEIEIGNPTNSAFGLMYVNEKRLTSPQALKIFYSTKTLVGGTSFDKNTSIYVSTDNEEHLKYFIEYIIKSYQIVSNTKIEHNEAEKALLKSFVFYLPSSVQSENDFNKWKTWSREINITPTTPLSEILDQIQKKSGMRLFDDDDSDQGKHVYLNCLFEHLKDSSLDFASQTIEKPTIPNLQNMKGGMILNTGLTDLLQYVLDCQRLTLQEAESPLDANALLKKFDHFPANLFLPNFLVVQLADINKMLEMGEILSFDYLEDKIKREAAPISNEYRIVGLICAKKGTNPTQYYPVLKKELNIFDIFYTGYLGPDKEVTAKIFQIDKNLVHYILFERREIEF